MGILGNIRARIYGEAVQIKGEAPGGKDPLRQIDRDVREYEASLARQRRREQRERIALVHRHIWEGRIGGEAEARAPLARGRSAARVHSIRRGPWPIAS